MVPLEGDNNAIQDAAREGSHLEGCAHSRSTECDCGYAVEGRAGITHGVVSQPGSSQGSGCSRQGSQFLLTELGPVAEASRQLRSPDRWPCERRSHRRAAPDCSYPNAPAARKKPLYCMSSSMMCLVSQVLRKCISSKPIDFLPLATFSCRSCTVCNSSS